MAYCLLVVLAVAAGAAPDQTNRILQSIKQIGDTTSGRTITIDELVVFGDVKDQTWVTADYNSGSPLTYSETSTGIMHGWHFDETFSERANITFNGAYTDMFLANAAFTDIDASASAKPLRTWHGSATNCINIGAYTEQDIGGAGVSVTHY